MDTLPFQEDSKISKYENMFLYYLYASQCSNNMYLVHIINTELGRGSAKQVGDNTATRWLNDKKNEEIIKLIPVVSLILTFWVSINSINFFQEKKHIF